MTPNIALAFIILAVFGWAAWIVIDNAILKEDENGGHSDDETGD